MIQSSLDVAREQLKEAAAAVERAQDDLIRALESGGARKHPIEVLEKALADAIAQRDDIAGTRDFIISRERMRLERESKKLSSIVYVSQWPSEDFRAFSPNTTIPQIAFQGNAKNESCGITGILYVLNGWFASYLEGDDASLDRLVKKLAFDERHRNFQVLERKYNFGSGKDRRYPDNGLMLKYCNAIPSTDPIEAAFALMCSSIELSSYIPRPVSKQKTVQQFLLAVAPFGRRLATACAGNPAALTAQIECVMQHLKSILEGDVRDDAWKNMESTYAVNRSVIGPHTTHGVAVCGGDGEMALSFALRLNEQIRGDSRCSEYCPVICIHYGTVEVVMDGTCTIVGAPLRYLRLMLSLSQQRGFAVMFSEAAAEAAKGIALTKAGTYSFDGQTHDVHIATALTNQPWVTAVDPMTAPSADAHEEEDREAIKRVAAERTAVRETKKVIPPVTNDDLNARPLKGLPTEDEMKSIFEGLQPDAAGTISLGAFTSLCDDPMGVPESVQQPSELLLVPRGGSSTSFPMLSSDVRISFDHFVFLYMKRFRG